VVKADKNRRVIALGSIRFFGPNAEARHRHGDDSSKGTGRM